MNSLTTCSVRPWPARLMLSMIAACMLLCTQMAMAQSGVTLSLTKTHSAPNPVPSGQVFTYTLTYSYSGATAFTTSPGTLIIRDTLPPTLDVISATSGATISGQVVTFTVSGLTLAAGGGTVQINARFKPGVTCPQTMACNVAYLSVLGDLVQVASNQSCVVAWAENKWQLYKTWHTGCLVDSGEVLYQIDVYNPPGNDIGGLNLNNVSLLDVLPPGAVITAVTHTAVWTGVSPTTGTAVFTGGPTNFLVEAGPHWYSVTFTVRFPGTFFVPGQVVSDTAKLVFQTPCSGGAYDTMYRVAQNTLCGPTPAGTIEKRLALRTSFDPNPWYTPTWAPGCCGTYIITYQNTSGATQTSVEIDDMFPPTVDVGSIDVIFSPGVTSVTVDVFYSSSGICSPTPGASTTLFWGGSWTPPPGNICRIRWRYTGTFLPSASTASYISTCLRSTSYDPPYAPVVAGQPVINRACVSGINVPPGLCTLTDNPVDPSAPNILAVKFFEGRSGSCVMPSCTPSTAGPFYPGDIVRFRMAVANVGNMTATSCTISDILPPGFKYWGNDAYFYGGLSGTSIAMNNPSCCALNPTVPAAIGGTITPSPIGATSPTWHFPMLPATCGGGVEYLVIEFDVKVEDTPPCPPGNYFNTFTFSAGNLPMPVTSTRAEVTINGTAQIQCEKEVRPYISSSSFSSSASVQAGNQAEYRIRLRNTGSMGLSDIYLLDILPHLGDIDVLPFPLYGPRGSQFDMPITSPITPSSFTDRYNSLAPPLTQNPMRSSLFCSMPPDPGGAVAGVFVPWGAMPPGASTFSFEISSVPGAFGTIAPGATQDFYFLATVPPGTPVGLNACNSFGLQAIPVGTTTCLTVESAPACVTVIPPDRNQCDSIWGTPQLDACCGFNISVLNTAGNISSLAYNFLPIGGGTPSGALQSITTSPCLPSSTIPATLPGTTSGVLNFLPACGSPLNVNLQATAMTPSGEICVELIAVLTSPNGVLAVCRDTICFHCDPAPQQRCDSMGVRAYPNGNLSMRTFSIFNMKAPVSPICSVKINVVPPPGGPGLFGSGLIIDGTPQSWPAGTSSNYTQILPIHGLPASSSVLFNLGVSYGMGWVGNVTVTIYHCDGDSCTTQYGPWDASKMDTVTIVTPTPTPDPSTLHMHSLDFSTAAATGLNVRSVAIHYSAPVTEIVAATGATYPCDPGGQGACNDIFEMVHVKDRSLMIDLRRPLDNPINLNNPILTVVYRASSDDDPTVEIIYYDENGQEVGHSSAMINSEPPPDELTTSGLTGGDRLAAILGALTARPNPTAGHCDLGFSLPAAANVELELLDIRGAHVATVITGEQLPAGEHHRLVDMTAIPSGSYIVALRVNGVPSVLRVELTK